MDQKKTHSDHSENDADRTEGSLGWRRIRCILRDIHGIDGHIQGGKHVVLAFRLIVGIHGFGVHATVTVGGERKGGGERVLKVGPDSNGGERHALYCKKEQQHQ